MLNELMNKKIKISEINVIILFLLLKLLKVNCEDIECKKNPSLFNTKCFNNLLLFNNRKYRSGHFASNKNGDLIIEFSEDDANEDDDYRLFYGLKSDGRYYFKNEQPTYEFQITGAKNDDASSTYYGRYESNNLFVSLNNNEDTEYLFSVSSFNSIVELHNLTSDNSTHLTWTSKKFFGFDEEHIHSHIIPIFKIKNEYTYIITFLPRKPHTNADVYSSDSYIIKKFQFNSFDANGYNEINSTKSDNNFNNRIISTFSMDDCDILVVFFVYRTKTEHSIDYGKYMIRFYDYSLNFKNEIDLTGELSLDSGNGLFFKGFYLKEKFASFIYFTVHQNGKSLNLGIMELNENNGYNFDSKISYNINSINFNTYFLYSDFFKIDDKRITYISTEGDQNSNNRFLHFLLIDLYNNYAYMKIRIYSFDTDYIKIEKELSGFVYNGYLLFAATPILNEEAKSEIFINYFSIFMIIGYANGTDSTIDISSYFSDSGNYDVNINFSSFLFENLTIDNNIFGYIPDDKIKLVSIPDEILLYQSNDMNTSLTNNSYLYINESFTLKQNTNLIKTSEYYYIY